MEHCAEFEIAQIRRSLVHKHVANIRRVGIVILFIMVVKGFKAFVEFCKDQQRIYHGWLKVETLIAFCCRNLTVNIHRYWRWAAAWWRHSSTTTSKLSLSSSFLLCGDDLCSLWSNHCLDQVCQGWVTYKYLAVLTKGLSDRRISTCLYLHWQGRSCNMNYNLNLLNICIDKACLVLRTSISNGSWDMWKKTTWFVVDSYHYVNHRTTDYICRKWCNPAPLNGSAPNLVLVVHDKHGRPHYKRAFNTQVCCFSMPTSSI